MNIKLEDRSRLIARAKYLMGKYSYDPLFALKIAEQEFERNTNRELDNQKGLVWKT